MNRAAFLLGLAGGATGVAVSVALIAGSAVDGDPHKLEMSLGVSALLAAGFGMVCAALYRTGRRRGLLALGLLVAAGWHVASSPIAGMAPGTNRTERM